MVPIRGGNIKMGPIRVDSDRVQPPSWWRAIIKGHVTLQSDGQGRARQVGERHARFAGEECEIGEENGRERERIREEVKGEGR
ncbi:hypothetical protein LINPERHAP2_LOCUS40889 [Linum perenne]